MQNFEHLEENSNMLAKEWLKKNDISHFLKNNNNNK